MEYCIQEVHGCWGSVKSSVPFILFIRRPSSSITSNGNVDLGVVDDNPSRPFIYIFPEFSRVLFQSQ